MRPQGQLQVSAGVCSETGKRSENQDFVGVYSGTATERIRHGIVAALADGVSGAKGGRIAAELAVRTLIDGLYEQPDTLGIAACAHRVLAPYNRWLVSMGRTDTMTHAATTFTGFVLRGRQANVIHVGDSRAWHFRDGKVTQLTQDHCHAHPDQRHILYRAIGIEDRLRLDAQQVLLEQHDRLLLTSDGVHGTLSQRQIERILAARSSAEASAQALVEAALEGGSQDNASAVVLDIVELPAPDHDSIAGDVARLPILPPPNEGESIDGFRLDQMISDGRYTRLFKATDSTTGQNVAVKFPKPAILSENGARLAFSREMLVGARINSPFVAATIPLALERQTRLYGVQPFYEGITLEERLKRPVPLDEAVKVATQISRGLAALHRLDIVHRDIKPDNIILTSDGGLKLIDLGVARLPNLDEFSAVEIPGTPGYLAPEMFAGNAGDNATDQFALGVTLWRLFVGRFPYGEAEAFSKPRFGKVDLPSKARPELPAWLDALLMRTIALEPMDRFSDAIELLRALEGGAAVARIPLKRLPLITRHPERFWQSVSIVLFLALMVSLLTRN